MSFVPILDLAVSHAFYTDGRCADLALKDAPETAAVLRRHRIVAKRRAGGLTLVASTDAEGKLEVPFDGGEVLAFRLSVVDPAFPMFTDLAEVAQQAAPLFTNEGSAGEPVLRLTTERAWGVEALALAEPSSDLALALGGRPAADATASDFEVEGAGAVRVTGYSRADRTVRLDASSASPGAEVALRYPVAPRLGRGVFANVEVRAEGVLPKAGEVVAAAPRSLRIAFTPKRLKWAYYVVTDVKREAGALAVIDTARNGPALAFSPANTTELSDAPDASDAIATELSERYPDLRRVRFVSDEPVACRQAPRKNIELHLNGDRIYGALPNPSFHNFSTLGSGSGDEARSESLFEIVKHVTSPLPTRGA